LDKIAESYPKDFESRFQDIIDLLVGWYIDTSVSDSLHLQIADLFKKLRPFWSQHLDFAYELMSHFLVDMEALSRGMISPEGSQVDNDEIKNVIPTNLKVLLSCFQAVTAAIVPVLSQKLEDVHTINDSNADSDHPFDRLRSSIVNFILTIGETYMDTEWFEKGIQTILALSVPRKEHFVHNQIQAIKFWLLQVQNGFQKECSASVFDEWFDCLLQVLAHWFPHVHQDVIYTLLNPNSSLMKLRWVYPFNSRFHSDFMDLIRFFFSSTSEKEESSLIHQITSEIGLMISFILLSPNNAIISKIHPQRKNFSIFNVVQENQEFHSLLESLRLSLEKPDIQSKSHILDERSAMLILTFDIEILSELACAWGHAGEVFLTLYVIINKIIEHDYFEGVIMNLLLNTLRRTSKSEDYFIDNSKGKDLVAPTFLAMITIILTFLQNQRELSFNSLSLLLEWTRDILLFCKNHQFSSIESKSEIQKEISQIICILADISGIAKNINIRLQIPKIIGYYFDVFGTLHLREEVFSKIIDR
ncbi:11130_t:CDS:2, partial [Acaulospora morrowiae]